MIPNPTIPTRYIESRLVATEADLQTRFLGEDLSEACLSAVAVEDPVLFATSALPVARRREALVIWRKRIIAGLLSSIVPLHDFFSHAPLPLQESIREGKTTLRELDELAANFADTNAAEKNASIAAAKDAMNNVLRTIVRDPSTNELVKTPNFVVVRQDGDFGLFRARRAAVDWARDAGLRFFLGKIDLEHTSIFPGAEPD